MRSIRRMAPAVALLVAFAQAPAVLAKSNYANPYYPPLTIDLLVIQSSNGSAYPAGSCIKVTEYPTYNFHTYTTEVLPNEWGSSWYTQSLRAGAQAVKNYGWASTMITGHTCAASYNADLTNTTYDQVWYSGSAVTSTTDAMNRTYATRMYDPNLTGISQIWRTQYVAGSSTDPCGTVSGYSASNTLGQWGSYNCAQGGWTWEGIDTTEYYYGYSSTLENDQDLLINPTFEHDRCGSVTSRWNVSTGVTATTTCSSTNNIEGTHFARVDGTGSGNTNTYTAIYQDPWETVTGTTFTFQTSVRCLSGTCTFTPRLSGLGGTTEIYDGTSITVSDSFWRVISVTHSLSAGHTQVRGLVRGDGHIIYDIDAANLW